MRTLTPPTTLADTIALIERRFTRLDTAAAQIRAIVTSMALHLHHEKAGAQ